MVGAPPRSPSAPCPARNLCTQLSGAYTPAQSCPAASAQEMQNVTPPTTVCGAGAPSVTLRSLLPPLLSDWVGGHEAGPPCCFYCAWPWGYLSPVTSSLVQKSLWLSPHWGQSLFLSLAPPPPCPYSLLLKACSPTACLPLTAQIFLSHLRAFALAVGFVLGTPILHPASMFLFTGGNSGLALFT